MSSIFEIQELAKTCLLANSNFTSIDFFLELDQTATPDTLAAFDTAFETALLTKGLAVIILSPHAMLLDQVKARGSSTVGGVSLQLVVPVAICENPEVNRGTADATATPPRAPLNRAPLMLLEQAIKALCIKFTMPSQPFGRPELGDGFWCYTLLPQRQHLIGTA